MQFSPLTVKDPAGWEVSIDPVTSTARICFVSLSVEHVPVFGQVQSLTPWTPVRVLQHNQQFVVVAGLSAKGGGCTSCT